MVRILAPARFKWIWKKKHNLSMMEAIQTNQCTPLRLKGDLSGMSIWLIPLLALCILLPGPLLADSIDDKNDFYGRYKLTNPTVKESSGTALIHHINLKRRTVNLTMDPIPNLSWPRKTRDMKVTRRVGLVRFRPGQRVRVHLKMFRDGHYRIFKMARL